MTDVDRVADELYGLALGQFIEARNAHAKALAASGDRISAASVRQLAKPSVAAWLGNVLVRRHLRALDELIELGVELRKAQERRVGAEMRRLSSRRQLLVKRLVALASDEAQAVGLSVGVQATRQLEGTLDAAVADPSAASCVRGGRLTEPLRHVGFGDVGEPHSASSARPARPTHQTQKVDADRKPAGTPRVSADRKPVTKPDNALAKARAALQSSQVTLDDANRRHEVAVIRRKDAARELRDADRELAQASAALEAVTQRRRRMEHNVKDAEREGRRRAKENS